MSIGAPPSESQHSAASCNGETEHFIFLFTVDWIVQIKFGLRLDIRSDLVDQTEFWSDLEDNTERLPSLEKNMQIRTKTEVCSKN